MAEHATRGRPKGSGIDDSAQLAAIARLIDADPTLKPTTAIKALGISDPSVIRRLRDKYSEMRCGSAAPVPAEAAEPRTLAHQQSNATSAVRPARAHAVAARSRAAAKRTAMPTEMRRESSAVAELEVAPVTPPRPRLVSTRADDGAGQIEPAPKYPTPKYKEIVAAGVAVEPKPAVDAKTHTAVPRAPEPCALSAQGSARAGNGGPKLSLKKPEDLFVALCGLGIAATGSAMAAQVSVSQSLVRNAYVSLALRQQLALNEWALQLMPTPAAKASRRG